MTEDEAKKLKRNQQQRERYARLRAAGKPTRTPESAERQRLSKLKGCGLTAEGKRLYAPVDVARMTLREVGVILGVSATTVMMEERAALQKFCDRLEEACEDMREEFYAGLESNRTGNSGGVQRALPRCEMGRTG